METTKTLYKITYQDVDGKVKTYMNNSAFSEDKADEEIDRIKRDFPERKDVTKKPVMIIAIPKHINTDKQLRVIERMKMDAVKLDELYIKRSIKNNVLINVTRQISKLALESVFIRSIDGKPLMFSCYTNIKHNFDDTAYMTMKSCTMYVLQPVDVIKQRIQEFITYVKYSIENSVDIKFEEKDSMFEEHQVQSIDHQTMNDIIKVSFVLHVSISDTYMNKLYDKTRRFLSMLD